MGYPVITGVDEERPREACETPPGLGLHSQVGGGWGASQRHPTYHDLKLWIAASKLPSKNNGSRDARVTAIERFPYAEPGSTRASPREWMITAINMSANTHLLSEA